MSESVDVSGTMLTKVLLEVPEGLYEGGKCMDGTVAGYYYSQPSTGSSDVWVIFLEGGGGCGTEDDCDQFATKKNGTFGGSERWKQKMQPGGLMSSSEKRNPFHNAHHVYVRYCTGDMHAGSVSTPTNTTWNYTFDGHLNVKAIVHHLSKVNVNTMGAAAQAKRVLLSGSSAGGKGVFFNCDFLQSYLTQLGSSASVSCSPMASWFWPGFNEDNPEDPDATPTPWPAWSAGQLGPGLGPGASPLTVQQYYLPEACVADRSDEPWKCLSAHVMYPYIQRPMFVIQDMYDTSQIHAEGQLNLPKSEVFTQQEREFIAYFGQSMRKSTKMVEQHPKGKQGDGLFLTSCYAHGQNTANLSGTFKYTALYEWFIGSGEVAPILVDDCEMTGPGLPCNSGCAGVPDGSDDGAQQGKKPGAPLPSLV